MVDFYSLPAVNVCGYSGKYRAAVLSTTLTWRNFMVSFCVAVAVLLFGYFIYAKVVEKIFGIKSADAAMPVYTKADGVDYVRISEKKALLIQFISIAGTGPIFGAIAGALWGPASFFWIVLGCVFAGATHDYMSGMLSVRQDGATLGEIVGKHLGPVVKVTCQVFSIGLLIMVGAVFTMSPSDILATISPFPREVWMVIIMVYFAVATIIPINKLIAKIYPVFGAGMILLGVGMAVALFATGNFTAIPEFKFNNPHPRGTMLFPYLFVTIACGAISGFHATQSPLMARCIGSEKEGRLVFYGAMIFEGFMALIWAAVAMTFFPDGIEGLANAGLPAQVVSTISFAFFGTVGGIISIICVGIFPISTGDTALRASRLAIADALKLEQASIKSRFLITVPLFAIVIALLFIDFTILWRYFAWMNQTLAVFTLWASAVYLVRQKSFHWICTLPAVFMTFMTMSYIFVAKEGLGLPPQIGCGIGGAITVACITVFAKKCLFADSRRPAKP